MKYKLKKYNLNILSETTVNKLLSFHNNNGYIIISAWRGENSVEQNKKLNSNLKKDIKKSKFSFIPVWGGFIETDKITGKTRQVKEQSFIIFNIEKGKSTSFDTSEELKKFGLNLCKKYNQESFLYKPKGEDNKASYVNKSGQIDQTFSTTSPTKSSDVYFTTLRKRDTSKSNRAKDDLNKAFTYNESIYFPKSPKTLFEAYKRYGELFINF